MNNFYMNVYDRTTGNAWREEFENWKDFYKRYCKLKYSKKLMVLSHSNLDQEVKKMLKRLKAILNSYTDEELEKMDLWVNSTECAVAILVDDNDIDLITNSAEIKINGRITKESNKQYKYTTQP